MTIQTVTWDNATKGSNVTLSNGDLTAYFPNSQRNVMSTLSRSTKEKFYSEYTLVSSSNNYFIIGICPIENFNGNIFASQLSDAIIYSTGDGRILDNKSAVGTVVVSTVGDIIGVLLDLDMGQIEFRKNGTYLYSLKFDSSRKWVIIAGYHSTNNNGTITANFGASRFNHDIPKDYYSYDKHQGGISRYFINLNNKHYSIATKFTDNIVPTMTQNIEEYGIASSGSVNGSTAIENAAWKAFDGNSNTWWLSSNVFNDWIAFDFKRPVLIKKYSLTVSRDTATAPKNFNLQGLSGENWVTLDTITGYNKWALGIPQEFEIKNNDQYFTKYRLYMTSTTGTYYSLSEFNMYSEDSVLLSLEDVKESNYIDFGLKESDIINLQENTKYKKYIKSTNESLGSGKIFRQIVQAANHPIKEVLVE